MGRVLLHLCGPFAIYSYGLLIAVAASFFVYFLTRDERFKQLNLEPHFSSIFLIGVLSVLLGGRILHLLAVQDEPVSWIDFVSFWEPGFSVLGSTLAVIIFLPYYIRRCNIPLWPFADLVATYAGILQGVARTGCFFAGCCYGSSSTAGWSVLYTDPDSVAPLYAQLHPVQLYSAALLLLIFAWMYYVGRRILVIPGQQAGVYLMLSSSERFITDFWRGDRDFMSRIDLPLSIHQLIALGIFALGGLLYIHVTYFRRSTGAAH